MKKHSSSTGKRALGKVSSMTARMTIGIDLGDRTSRYAIVDGQGELVNEGAIATTRRAITKALATMPCCRIALEVGTHSPWVSRLITSLGHEVFVANTRQLAAITKSSRKSDRVDARMLARLARVDPQLLRPIRHRGEQTQGHLMKIRVRAALVEMRTAAINSARGLAKAVGERLPDCDADQMNRTRMKELPQWLSRTIEPLLAEAERLTGEIRECDRAIEQIARNEYPETKRLQQIWGIGTLIALTFVLTVEEPGRFVRSRDVGCYVGLRPERSQSGESDPELGITKEGDRYLRKLLVEGAHRILWRAAPDTDLKRWGQKLAARGGKNAKKRAIVAVARKLAILLHRLWVTGEAYEPLRNSKHKALKKAA